MKVTVDQKERTYYVTLEGWISEESDFSLMPDSGADMIVIDMEGVKRINSCGLRSWVKWMESIGSKPKVVLKNCQPWVVDQVNILDGFVLENTQVESFYVPYYCDSCEVSHNIKKVHGEDFADDNLDEVIKGWELDQVKCPKCGDIMELDVLSTKYFSFLGKKSK